MSASELVLNYISVLLWYPEIWIDMFVLRLIKNFSVLPWYSEMAYSITYNFFIAFSTLVREVP